MKMGDPRYFEREERHNTTTKMHSNTKEAIAFYFAAESPHYVEIDLPADLSYSV